MIFPNIYKIDEASDAIQRLREQLNEYGVMSIADVYYFMKNDNPLLELPLLTHKYNVVGWDYRDADGIELYFVKGGAKIKFPKFRVLAFRL